MKDIIERLKDKNYVRAFGLMTEDEQECFKKVGKQANCLRFDGKKWADGIGYGPDFVWTISYAIKPDYNPEPEYVDLEIFQSTKYLGVNISGEFHNLFWLSSLPKFEGFFRKDTCSRVNIDKIATMISKGIKVYARFRK